MQKQLIIVRVVTTLLALLALSALAWQVNAIVMEGVNRHLLQSETVFPDPVELDSVTLAHDTGCSWPVPDDFEVVLEAAASEFGVDSRLLSTTVWRESDCNLKALGASGEIGLTQINPSIWLDHLATEVGITGSLWDMKNNLRAGAYVLSYCQGRHHGLKDTFRCYNGSGPQAEKYAVEQVEAFASAWL